MPKTNPKHRKNSNNRKSSSPKKKKPALKKSVKMKNQRDSKIVTEEEHGRVQNLIEECTKERLLGNDTTALEKKINKFLSNSPYFDSPEPDSFLNEFFSPTGFTNDFLGLQDTPLISSPFDIAPMEDWKELYEAVKWLQNLQAWEWMQENELFGVEDPKTGEIGYCLVLGKRVLYDTFIIFLGEAALYQYASTLFQNHAEKLLDPESFRDRQDCIVVSYEPEMNLDSFDRELIRVFGHLQLKNEENQKENNAKWPKFRIYSSNFPSSKSFTRKQIIFLKHIFQQACDIVIRVQKNALSLIEPMSLSDIFLNYLNDLEFLICKPTIIGTKIRWTDSWSTIPVPKFIDFKEEESTDTKKGENYGNIQVTLKQPYLHGLFDEDDEEYEEENEEYYKNLEKVQKIIESKLGDDFHDFIGYLKETEPDQWASCSLKASEIMDTEEHWEIVQLNNELEMSIKVVDDDMMDEDMFLDLLDGSEEKPRLLGKIERDHITQLIVDDIFLPNFFRVHIFHELETLIISNGGLTFIPDILPPLSKLRVLSFSNNVLKKLPPSFGNLKNLQSLNLRDNHLTKLPSIITTFHQLQALEFRSNSLNTLPDSIGHLTSLVFLDLSMNLIEKLPSSIKDLQNLKYLNLSDNPLRTIPSELGQLKALRYLALPNILAPTIPDSFLNLKNLKVLLVEKLLAEMNQTILNQLRRNNVYIAIIEGFNFPSFDTFNPYQ